MLGIVETSIWSHDWRFVELLGVGLNDPLDDVGDIGGPQGGTELDCWENFV